VTIEKGEQPAIPMEGLSKRYGDIAALADVNLEVAPGEVLGYLGPNGAEKTTTNRILLGLINPTAGRAEVFGVDCQRQPIEAHRRVAFVPGEANLWPSLTGAETLHLLGRIHGDIDPAYRDELIDRFEAAPGRCSPDELGSAQVTDSLVWITGFDLSATSLNDFEYRPGGRSNSTGTSVPRTRGK
jgi:ABC-type multidrug transport system ATPase subunit